MKVRHQRTRGCWREREWRERVKSGCLQFQGLCLVSILEKKLLSAVREFSKFFLKQLPGTSSWGRWQRYESRWIVQETIALWRMAYYQLNMTVLNTRALWTRKPQPEYWRDLNIDWQLEQYLEQDTLEISREGIWILGGRLKRSRGGVVVLGTVLQWRPLFDIF